MEYFRLNESNLSNYEDLLPKNIGYSMQRSKGLESILQFISAYKISTSWKD